MGLHFDLHGADREAIANTIVITGQASVGVDDPPADQMKAFVEKYQEFVSRIGITLQQAAALSPVALRVRPLMVDATSFA